MLVENLKSLQEAREHFASDIRIQLQSDRVDKGFEKNLKKLLLEHGAKGPGFISEEGCPIAIQYSNKDAQANLVLNSAWRVPPNDDLLDDLREMFGNQAVQLHYPQ